MKKTVAVSALTLMMGLTFALGLAGIATYSIDMQFKHVAKMTAHHE